MRQILLPTLLLCLGLAACADHGSIAIVADGPQAPINEPDNRIVDPGNGGSTANQGGLNDPGNGGQGSNTGGGTGGSTTGGSQNGGGEPGGGSGGSEPGGGSGGGGGGGGGASPVPEPGTLLLVGTGLAGLAGVSLRRRQRKAKA